MPQALVLKYFLNDNYIVSAMYKVQEI
jgi:hypothetical protein